MGIVQEVRTATGNDQTVVDCAGLSGKERVDRFVAEAFGEALPASSAGCQVTLTIGGGKQTRGKYDPVLGKLLSDALKAHGYTEDRGASRDTPKTFKHQHDTSKNLVFMHVYPDCCAQGGGEERNWSYEFEEEEEESDPCEGLLEGPPPPARTLGVLLARMPLEAFREVVRCRAASYTAKKRALESVKEMGATVAEIEGKMARVEPLSETEELLYEAATEVAEKRAHLEGELKAHLAGTSPEHALTRDEARAVSADLEGKAKQLAEAAEGGAGASKGKKAKLEAMLGEVRGALDALKASSGAHGAGPGAPLAHAERLALLYKSLAAFDIVAKKMEKNAATVEEMASYNRNVPGIKDEADQLEGDSRELFEADDEFEARCAPLKAEAARAVSKMAGAKKGKASGGGPKREENAWGVVSSKGAGGRSGGGTARTGGGARGGAANAFAALSMDD